tara:strand:+ start:64465 stop:65811 length:1347 start_codon:yes stop_codon:yes gene_type:complete
MKKYNILLLANDRHITTAVTDHIHAITNSQENNWIIENPLTCKTLHKLDLNMFDAIGFHYSIRPHDPYYLPKALYKKIQSYQGVKFQFLQDEYQRVNVATKAMIDLNINLLFTLVKPSLVEQAYNLPELLNMKKVSILTGYTPSLLENINTPLIKDRHTDIFYRGRLYDYWLGKLAQDRKVIADGVGQRAKQYNLKIDISVSEQQRIYGQEWFKKHMESKAVLGTESGSSIWDYNGQAERDVKSTLKKYPNLKFDEVYDKVLNKYEGNLMYNASSPRLLEAISLRTTLIMFPGEYSGLCEPDKHYIALEKDFSNFKDVVNKLRDDDYLQNLVDFAYEDIIASGRFSQSKLTNLVNSEITKLISNNIKEKTGKINSTQHIYSAIKKEKQKHVLLNTYHIFASELAFSLKNVFSIFFDPRYTFKKKISVFSNGIKRYFVYILPRFKRNSH